MFDKAPQIFDITTPAKIIREVVTLPPIPERKNTINATKKDPKNPQKVTLVFAKTPVNTVEAPTIIENVAPKDAPEERPRMYGSANGFCTVACIITPDKAKLIPTTQPISTRGKRMVQTISYTAPVPGFSNPFKVIPVNLYNICPYTSLAVIGTVPAITAKVSEKISMATNPITPIANKAVPLPFLLTLLINPFVNALDCRNNSKSATVNIIKSIDCNCSISYSRYTL